MIHLDRLHKAICRLTGRPFTKVHVGEFVEGTYGKPVWGVVIRVDGLTIIDGPSRIRETIRRIKRHYGWNSATQSHSSSSQSSRPASGLNGTHAPDRRPLQPEAGSRART